MLINHHGLHQKINDHEKNSARVHDVIAVLVKRHPVTKSISLNRTKKRAWGEWHFTTLVREAYYYFIDTVILKISNFKLTNIE